VIGVPISNPDAKDLIPNSYIVVYNSSASDAIVAAHQAKFMDKVAKRNIGKRALDGRPLAMTGRQFQVGGWRAMALEADDKMMLEIFDSEEVDYIEQDAMVSHRALSTQTDATTGLARLSHSDAGERGYVFDSSAGQGITAYVVDTGIKVDHNEFEGRATFAANFVNTVVCSAPRRHACLLLTWQTPKPEY